MISFSVNRRYWDYSSSNTNKGEVIIKNETHQIEDPQRSKASQQDEGLCGRVGCDVLGHPAEPHETDDEDDEVDDAAHVAEEGARREEHPLRQHLQVLLN